MTEESWVDPRTSSHLLISVRVWSEPVVLQAWWARLASGAPFMGKEERRVMTMRSESQPLLLFQSAVLLSRHSHRLEVLLFLRAWFSKQWLFFRSFERWAWLLGIAGSWTVRVRQDDRLIEPSKFEQQAATKKEVKGGEGGGRVERSVTRCFLLDLNFEM